MTDGDTTPRLQLTSQQMRDMKPFMLHTLAFEGLQSRVLQQVTGSVEAVARAFGRGRRIYVLYPMMSAAVCRWHDTNLPNEMFLEYFTAELKLRLRAAVGRRPKLAGLVLDFESIGDPDTPCLRITLTNSAQREEVPA